MLGCYICQGAGTTAIMGSVKTERRHDWQLGVAQARDVQRRLSLKVSRAGEVITPRLIAGVDVAAGKARGMARAAVVVLSFPELRLVEMEVAQGRLNFPYIPGLLSFRESPLILAACQRLSVIPDLMMVDGQGIAHPRRMGLASHLGLLLGIPTIGCAKSRLCGSHKPPAESSGNYAELVDRGETIGVALRTRAGAKPVYVSIGHSISLSRAIHWVLECCRGYRLPEPTRLAHLAAGGNLKMARETVVTEAGY